MVCSVVYDSEYLEPVAMVNLSVSDMAGICNGLVLGYLGKLE